jgi:hypothetical protein
MLMAIRPFAEFAPPPETSEIQSTLISCEGGRYEEMWASSYTQAWGRVLQGFHPSAGIISSLV